MLELMSHLFVIDKPNDQFVIYYYKVSLHVKSFSGQHSSPKMSKLKNIKHQRNAQFTIWGAHVNFSFTNFVRVSVSNIYSKHCEKICTKLLEGCKNLIEIITKFVL